jgi:DNA replication and repair protein RecF
MISQAVIIFMSLLKRLQITNLRNLDNVSITLSPDVNLFYGKNGSGKTSLLEAIALLGLGRSFRSHKIRTIIEHAQPQLTIFGELASSDNHITTIGIQKTRSGQNVIRVNGDNVQSAISLAQQLPLQIINADSFLLLEGSSSQRRRFLDWMVFHVKPEFADAWKRLQRIIKQRNSVLKRDKITYSDIAVWDLEFVNVTKKINTLRKEVLYDFMEFFFDEDIQLNKLGFTIDITYIAGWNEEEDFADILEASFIRDSRSGYTHYGPHRADLRFRVGLQLASDILSRGQEKALICSLHIAQALLFSKKTNKHCVFLVDDLLAELDSDNAKKLSKALMSLNCQVFVTGIYKDNLLSVWSLGDNQADKTTISLFHVEQGTIKQNNN